jgi:hypothetical protein
MPDTTLHLAEGEPSDDRWAPSGRTRMREPKSVAVVDVYMAIDIPVFARICAALGKAGFQILASDQAEPGDFSPPETLRPQARGQAGQERTPSAPYIDRTPKG